MSEPTTYLLVEDDETQACLLKKWLIAVVRPREISVAVADNLEDGVRLSSELRPLATFLDLGIPLRKGEQVCADWRKIAGAVPEMKPPVIGITSSEVTPEMRIYCITENRMHNLYRKPFNEGFFAKLRDDVQLFAGKLIEASSDAVLRSEQLVSNGQPR